MPSAYGNGAPKNRSAVRSVKEVDWSRFIYIVVSAIAIISRLRSEPFPKHWNQCNGIFVKVANKKINDF